MLQIDHNTLKEGLERATDLLKLQRLSTPEEAETLAATVFANFGIDEVRRIELTDSLNQMLPITGEPHVERVMSSSMSEGVLVGLLLADAALRAEPDLVPDRPPADL